MESLKRSIMLLKPQNSHMELHGKNTGTLRLEAMRDGVALSLKTDCLKEDSYSVYLFLQNGSKRFAGNLSGGNLYATLYDTQLEDILGAAVIHNETENPSFCLISSGLDWDKIIERFRITQVPHTSKPDNVKTNTHKEEQIQNIEALVNEMQGAEIQEEIEKNEDQVELPSVEDSTEHNQNTAQDRLDDTHIKLNHEPPKNEMCDTCPHIKRQIKINPFPSVFPNSAWVKISYPGPTGWWHYISGTIYKDDTIAAKVLGVPGEYGMAPPIWLEGFGTYMRCATDDARGYWLMFQDAETGEVLDPA